MTGQQQKRISELLINKKIWPSVLQRKNYSTALCDVEVITGKTEQLHKDIFIQTHYLPARVSGQFLPYKVVELHDKAGHTETRSQ